MRFVFRRMDACPTDGNHGWNTELPLSFRIGDAAAARLKEVHPFVGFAPLFAWHFCFWFAPTAAPFTDLLSADTTASWLAYLATSVGTLLIAAFVLGNKRRLRSDGRMYALAPMMLGVLSLASSYGPLVFDGPLQRFVIPMMLGAVESYCFLLWGERLSSLSYRGTSTDAVVAVAAVVVAAFVAAMVLPGPVTAVFVALLPVLSGFALVREGEGERGEPSVLKPRAVRKRADRNIAVVSGISATTCAACFFLLTIIPSHDLIGGDWAYGYGLVAGTLAILLASAVVGVLSKADNPFRIIPWLLVMVLVAFALFLGLRGKANGFSFFFITLVYSSFELLLMVYFVVVAQKGAASSAIAIGVSLGLFRLGVLAGDSVSISLESAGLEVSTLVDLMASICLCVVAVLLLPFVSEGRYMETLTKETADIGGEALAKACDDTAKEFGLSPREREVLELIVRGYAVDNMAEKLVISPHTVRAHIRHVYEKTQMHKKSVLIGYVMEQTSHYEG